MKTEVSLHTGAPSLSSTMASVNTGMASQQSRVSTASRRTRSWAAASRMFTALFPDGGEEATGTDYVILMTVICLLSLLMLVAFSDLFGQGSKVYALLLKNSHVAQLFCGLTLLFAMILHVFNIYEWSGRKKYYAAGLLVICVFKAGILVAWWFPAGPIIVMTLLWPLAIALVRYGRAGGVSFRSFYGVTLITCVSGSLSCIALWAAWVLDIGLWSNEINVSMQSSEHFQRMHEAYGIGGWEACVEERKTLAANAMLANDYVLNCCRDLELIAFLIYSCPLVEAMVMLSLAGFCGLRVKMLGREDASLNLIFMACGGIAGCVWIASAVAGGSMGLSNVFLGAVFLWGGVLAVWVAFSHDVKEALAKAETSVLFQTAKPLLEGEAFAAFLFCTSFVFLVLFLLLEVVSRQAQRLMGFAGESRAITKRGLRALRWIMSKHWAFVLDFTWLMSFIYIFFKLFAMFTPVFLGYLGEILATMAFGEVLAIFYVVGLLMFLLPPVPGVPVYVAAGSICVTRGIQEPWLETWSGVVLVSAFALLIKLTAVVGQQKGFGEYLGSSMAIQGAVGVHTPTIKAIELILQKPGMGIEKICILCGGPDWPTSVLTGILQLSCPQMLLGTLPCFFLILPCVLAGAALSNPDIKDWGALFMMMAATTQGAMGLAAMAFIATAQEKYNEELQVVRPEHEALVQQSEEAARKKDTLKRALAWSNLPVLPKFALLLAAAFEWLGAALTGSMSSACFRNYEIGTPLRNSFQEGGLEGNVINLFIFPGGYAVLGLMVMGLVWYILYKTLLKMYRQNDVGHIPVTTVKPLPEASLHEH
eukprot:TRINITY_DN120852_c0_g1_i1.p1 TRINITY_DN120852_c0_g1~~TRINITY_DN120852_c0_g1_i1.p1  ORF type:complete len:818 (-),score=138.23 TRINITY_DN120852_c0_g1_i1:26-2479(-)